MVCPRYSEASALSGKISAGAAGGDRTHFWANPSATRATVGLRKSQQVYKSQKVDDPSG